MQIVIMSFLRRSSKDSASDHDESEKKSARRNSTNEITKRRRSSARRWSTIPKLSNFLKFRKPTGKSKTEEEHKIKVKETTQSEKFSAGLKSVSFSGIRKSISESVSSSDLTSKVSKRARKSKSPVPVLKSQEISHRNHRIIAASSKAVAFSLDARSTSVSSTGSTRTGTELSSITASLPAMSKHSHRYGKWYRAWI